MRLHATALAVVLGVLMAGDASAAITGVIKLQNEAFWKDTPQAVTKLMAGLHARLQEVITLDDFSHHADGEVVQVKFRGDAKPGSDAKSAAERVRQAATAVAESLPGTKLAEYQVRIEVDEPATPERKAMRIEKEIEHQHRERARPSPRLEIQVKEKLFTELTVLEVPLVRVLDQIGRQMPLSYVLDVSVVHQPVFVRLQDATLEEALAAIADSGQLKIEKVGKYLRFSRAEPRR